MRDRHSVTGRSRAGRAYLAAIVFTLIGGTSLRAQYYDPSPAIGPTSEDDCRALNQAWSERTEYIRQQKQQCWDSTFKQCGTDTRCLGREECSRCWPWKSSCGDVFSLWTKCESLDEQYECARANANAQVSACYSDLRAYQKQQQEERKKKEEEQRRAEQAAQDAKKNESSDGGSSSQGHDGASSKQDEKSAFQREVEAYNKETERLAELTAERNAQAHQYDRASAKATKKLASEAEKTATANKDVLTRLAELSGSLGPSSLGSGKTGGDSQSPGFDFGGGAPGLDSTLAAAGLAVDTAIPFASIPFSMVSRAFRAEIGLMNQVAAAVQNFDHLDPSFADRNFAAEFGQYVFSPTEFLRTVATNTAKGMIHEYVVKPVAERAGDAAAESFNSPTTVLRPVVMKGGGSVQSAFGKDFGDAPPHWIGTVSAPSASGASTIAYISSEGDYQVYWAPLRYDSPAVIAESWRRWWVSNAVEEGLDHVVDRLLTPEGR